MVLKCQIIKLPGFFVNFCFLERKVAVNLDEKAGPLPPFPRSIPKPIGLWD
jgi:hypothetical protein